MDAVDTDQSPLSGRTLLQLLEATDVLVVFLDRGGTIRYASAKCRDLLGYEPQELVGKPGALLLPPGMSRRAAARFERLRFGQTLRRQRFLVQKRDGAHVRLRLDAVPIRASTGEVEGVALAARDAAPPQAGDSDASAEEDAGGEGELVERIPAVVYVAEPGPEGPWRYVSRQIEEMLGYSAEEWMSHPTLWAERLHPDDRARVLHEEERDAARGHPMASEYRLVARDGRVVWVRDEGVLRAEPDGSCRYDGLLIDISERKAFETRLEFLAEHDAQTGLLNRRRITAEIEAELKRARRHPGSAAVLMADLDDLKQVNDSRGHAVGDLLINLAAEIMVERLRESDSVARIGGDEFVALLRGVAEEQAAGVARELVAAVRNRGRMVAGPAVRTGISIGVADIENGRSAAEVLEKADRAMYAAKRDGGGRVATASAVGA